MENRIKIEDGKFTLGGQPIWFNGTNTPWNNWNDFGGRFDLVWWAKHFETLRMAGINSTRIWINCNNDQNAVAIEPDGTVTGVSLQHWEDLQDLFDLAKVHGIFIMATPLSFDHFKDLGERTASATAWRNLLLNKKAESFATHYIVPFLERFGNHPCLWSIDLMNEPDWVFENKECGNIDWEYTSYLFAVCAAKIHELSEVLVTVGFSFPKYNSDQDHCEGNKISDAYLQSLYPNKLAYVDFWSPHYYDWIGPNYGVPFYITPAQYGMCPSKPSLIGECMAKGSAGETPGTENNTIATDYQKAYENGWHGVMPWTSNGVDVCGDLSHFAQATETMAKLPEVRWLY